MLTLHVKIPPEHLTAFVAWQAKFHTEIVLAPGFVSLEFLHCSKSPTDWMIVQRFSQPDQLTKWQSSDQYSQLVTELKTLVTNFYEEQLDEKQQTNGATEIFVTQVNPEKSDAYRAWSAKLHQYEATFPGFCGVYVHSPEEDNDGHWVTLLHFDSTENLDRWLKSPERQALFTESSTLITKLENKRMISPYIGWFASVVKEGKLPSVWQQSMMILMMLFPSVVLSNKYLSPLLSSLNPALATFLGNAVTVTLLAYPLMPIAIKGLNWWLVTTDPLKKALGFFLVILIYLIEIAIFWS